MFEVEWVYLNCFDCLCDLVGLNFDWFGLLFLMLDGFGWVDQVVYFDLLEFNFGCVIEVFSDGGVE